MFVWTMTHGLAAVLTLTSLASVLGCNGAASNGPIVGDSKTMDAHVTIYLEPPILNEGGAVIVAARPLSDEDWRAVGGGSNPAAGDTDNPKRAEVGPGDRHFGAVVSSPVTVVEFVYPENGSFTFNFLPTAEYEAEYGARLQTERVLVGSSDRVPDPDGGYVDWPSVSTIAVLGTKRSQSFARVADATAAAAFGDNPSVTRFEGVRTIALSPSQIERFVRG